MSIINDYMKNKGIDFELQGKVRKSLEFTMRRRNNAEKVEEILSKLTPALKKEVLVASRRKYLQKFDLFINNFSKNTLDQLTFSLKEVNFSSEEYIYEVNNSIYNL